MSKMVKLLPADVQAKLDDWMDGFSYEMVHFWERNETYMIVVVTTNNVVQCIRIWKNVFNTELSLSVDKNFDLEEGQ